MVIACENRECSGLPWRQTRVTLTTLSNGVLSGTCPHCGRAYVRSPHPKPRQAEPSNP